MNLSSGDPAAGEAPREDELWGLREGFRNLLPLIVKRLGTIPTLDAVLARAVPMLANEDLPVTEAARLVACDPALTGKVLKVINAPLYGLRNRVSTLAHALAMLGPGVLRRLADGIRSVAADERTREAWIRLWRHGLATALAGRRIALKVGYDLPDEAFTAGILHDLGAAVLLQYAPAGVDRARDLVAGGERTRVEAERELLGADHAQVGALIAERWNLPRLLRDVVRHHHESPAALPPTIEPKNRELVCIVAAADHLATMAGFGLDEGDAPEASVLAVGDATELTAAEVETIRNGLAADVDDAVAQGGFSSVLSRPAAGESPTAVRAVFRPAPAPRLSVRLDVLGDLLRELRAFENADEILPHALDRLRSNLGFDRVLYFDHAAGGRRLAGRHLVDGTPIEVEMRDLDLEVETHPRLSGDLEPGAARLLRVEEDADPLLAQLGVREAATVGFPLHGVVDGIVVVDNIFSEREMGADDLALLRVFALGVGTVIENRGLGQQARRLRFLADKDALMGINNRRSLMQSLQKDVEHAMLTEAPLTLVMIDVDHFKKWNDIYGHQVGDRVLRDLAEVVTATSRDSDVVGRYGGEEFLVILRDTTVDSGIIYAERLRHEVDGLRRRMAEEFPEVKLTLSMGVAQLQGKEGVESLIRRVDMALYAAKGRGRDRVCAAS
jgi:diguanylate cyclase (GGDEF)-like protein